MDTTPPPVPVASSPPPVQPDVLAVWPRSAQLLMAFLVGVAATLLAVRAYQSTNWSTRPTELQRGVRTYRIDLNQATRAELLQVPGIGEILATRIDERRRQRPFGKVEELIEVPGIGPATLERVRPWVSVQTEEEEEPTLPALAKPSPLPNSGMASGSSRGPGKKETSLTGPVPINQATVEELQRLPGIGPTLSRRIIEERQKRPFQTVDDLRRVPGLGPKTLEKLRPYVMVGSNSVSIVTVD
jgi:competence protein ComEA